MVRICALAAGSDPGVECETRAAGVTIKKIRPMIFGLKIFRLDLLFLLHQGKRKNVLKIKTEISS
jgi:hypothetical protein